MKQVRRALIGFLIGGAIGIEVAQLMGASDNMWSMISVGLFAFGGLGALISLITSMNTNETKHVLK